MTLYKNGDWWVFFIDFSFNRMNWVLLRLVVAVQASFLAAATSMNESTTTATPTKTNPTFTGLSYVGGLLILVVFVVAPVGMMAFRNRNSIVEFIKNR